MLKINSLNLSSLDLLKISKTKAFLEKSSRLEILSLLDFNIPNFYLLPPESFSSLGLLFANLKFSRYPNFNIRSYSFDPSLSSETLSSLHLTNLSLEDIILLFSLEYYPSSPLSRFTLMIDTEFPEEALISGRTVFLPPNLHSEFLIKPGANVREVDSVNFFLSFPPETSLVEISSLFLASNPNILDSPLTKEVLKNLSLEEISLAFSFISSKIFSLISSPFSSKVLSFLSSSPSFSEEDLRKQLKSSIFEWTLFKNLTGKKSVDNPLFYSSGGHGLKEEDLEERVVWWEFRGF